MKKGFLFKCFRSGFVLFISFGIAGFFLAIRSEPEREPQKNPVPVVTVGIARPEAITMTVDAFGTVIPRVTLELTAEVAGRVVFVHPGFKEGAAMAPDDIIVRIDQRNFLLDVRTAKVRIRQSRIDIGLLEKEIEDLKSDIALAKANERLTSREFLRVQKLNKQGFASVTNLDKAEQLNIQARMSVQAHKNSLSVKNSTLEQKVAALTMAQIDLDKAELALEKTEIKAGFDALVLEKNVELGEFIIIGQPLGRVYRQGGLDVEVRLPLDKMQWIDPLFERGELPRAVIAMTGIDGAREWPASVVRVKSAIDERTRTLPMVLEVDSPMAGAPLLRPGTFVHCTISGDRYDPVFVLPRHLLHPNDTVFVLDQGRLEKKKVTVLRRFKEEIFISQGLMPGDRIILSPLAGAVDGMDLLEQKQSSQGG